MKILLYSFVLCLVIVQCSSAQDFDLKSYANGVKYSVNSGIVVFVTIKVKTNGKVPYTAFARTLDVWSELYSKTNYEEGFGDIIYDIILDQELEVNLNEFERMKIYKVDKPQLKPKTVVKEYFDSTGVALSEKYDDKVLYPALSILASDNIIIFEEIEGPEINMEIAMKKYF